MLDILCRKDPVLRSVVETYGHPVVQVRGQGFAAMVHIILEQQVSIASAKATYRKLETHFGVIDAVAMTQASDEIFRALGVSRQKTSYIKDMADRVLSGRLDFASLAAKPADEAMAELLSIKGVGV